MEFVSGGGGKDGVMIEEFAWFSFSILTIPMDFGEMMYTMG